MKSFLTYYQEFFDMPTINLSKKIKLSKPTFSTVTEAKNSLVENERLFGNGEAYIEKNDVKGFKRFWFVIGDFFYGLRIIDKGKFYRMTFAVAKNLSDDLDGKTLVKNKQYPKLFPFIMEICKREVSDPENQIFSFRPAPDKEASENRLKNIRGRLYTMALYKMGFKNWHIDDEQYIYFSKNKKKDEIKEILEK